MLHLYNNHINELNYIINLHGIHRYANKALEAMKIIFNNS